MSALRLALREARAELGAGLRSGVVGLVFVGLAAYLLMSLTNADYVQKMGGADIPRNAPSLVYLMSTGCMFFLFFAWAWVFAQPLLRDRQASLHEVALSMPVSLPAVLWGRFIGAALVGGLLAGSLIAGFIATPLLDWLSMVPHGSVSAPPWAALAFAWFWLLLPAGVGIGALYYLATLKLRSVAGAFALSALLMLLWMFAVVVLKGGHINPMLAAALDPSLFTYAMAKVETWTPGEKRSALLPLTPEFLFNRFVWCVLPLVLLSLALRKVQREGMAIERPPRRKRHAASKPRTSTGATSFPPVEISATGWLRALASEAGWQLSHIVRRRGLWIGVAILLAMGILGGFVHGVWHAEGPMRARPEFLLPLLNSAMFLVVAFVVAALAGMVWRRDHVEGFDAMLDAAPAPSWLRPFGRVIAIVVVIVGLAVLPGVASLFVTALAEPSALSVTTPALYQLLVSAPALLELGLLVVLVHACWSRAAVAYPVSMLLTFFLVLNHELGLVDYPLYEVGIPAHLHLSGMTGWAPWTGYLSALAGYKLGLCVVLAALAAAVVPRGAEGRFARGPGGRLGGPVLVCLVIGLAVMVGLGWRLHGELVARGDYVPRDVQDRQAAEWERRWLRSAGRYSVHGGHAALYVESATGKLHGDWVLHGVTSDNGNLDAELPADVSGVSATVDDRTVAATIADDHLRLPLGDASGTHTVRLRWELRAPGWSAEGVPAWRGHDALWIRATSAMPRLGVDPSRIARSPLVRKAQGLPPEVILPAVGASVAYDAVAPVGEWEWAVRVDDELVASSVAGAPPRPLAFATGYSPTVRNLAVADMRVRHDATRDRDAAEVGEDVSVMRRCVARRLGMTTGVHTVIEWPRGLGGASVDGSRLLLPESPDWDVSATGVGRALRRADIAQALARGLLVDAAALRDGQGAAWWGEAVPGAIGLLCVGDADGVAMMRQVMALRADQVVRALAASAAPVGDLAQADAKGWATTYGPLAALGWTSRRSPEVFAAVAARIAAGQPVENAMGDAMSEAERVAAFGPPRASDLASSPDGHVTGQRWIWRQGAWVAQPGDIDALLLVHEGASIVPKPISAADRVDTDGVLVDALPSYPRPSQRASAPAAR